MATRCQQLSLFRRNEAINAGADREIGGLL